MSQYGLLDVHSETWKHLPRCMNRAAQKLVFGITESLARQATEISLQ